MSRRRQRQLEPWIDFAATVVARLVTALSMRTSLVLVVMTWVFGVTLVVIGSVSLIDGSRPHKLSSLGCAGWLIVLFAFVLTIAVATSAARRAHDQKLLAGRHSVERLRALHWSIFEQLVMVAFRAKGFAAGRTPSGADGGVDIVLERSGERVLVQCKQWRSRQVGVKHVRELAGVVAVSRGPTGRVRGALVCSGRFTPEAQRFAEQAGIWLIDGPALVRLLNDVATPVGPSGRRPSTLPRCPTCGGAMVRRRAKRGKHAGSHFWGCERFPDCRGIRPLAHDNAS